MRFAQILHNSLSTALLHASNKKPVEVHCFVLSRGQKYAMGQVFMAIDFQIESFSSQIDIDSRENFWKDFELGLKSSKHLSQVLGGKFTV